MNAREVVILSGVRTAIGDYGGALKDVSATELAATVVRAAVARAGIGPNETDHLVFGNVIHGEARDMYLARVACINCGLPQSTAVLTLNRLCVAAVCRPSSPLRRPFCWVTPTHPSPVVRN